MRHPDPQFGRFANLLTAWVVAVWAGTLCAAASLQAADPLNPLPEGYLYPRVSVPTVQPGAGATQQRLFMADRDKAIHLIELDRTEKQWLDGLLRIEVGWQEPWSPEIYYVLYPQGFHGYDKTASAIFMRQLISFEKKLDPTSPEDLRSINRPEYSLSRDEEHLVVSKIGGRRWFFESIDSGDTWRLIKMDWTQHPGLTVEIRYAGDKIVAIRLPDGRETTIEYGRPEYPVRIKTAFGDWVEIERTAGASPRWRYSKPTRRVRKARSARCMATR